MPRAQHQMTRDMYRRVQLAYREAITDGVSPIDLVCKRLGVSESVAKRRIYRARQAGYRMAPDDSP